MEEKRLNSFWCFLDIHFSGSHSTSAATSDGTASPSLSCLNSVNAAGKRNFPLGFGALLLMLLRNNGLEARRRMSPRSQDYPHHPGRTNLCQVPAASQKPPPFPAHTTTGENTSPPQHKAAPNVSDLQVSVAQPTRPLSYGP